MGRTKRTMMRRTRLFALRGMGSLVMAAMMVVNFEFGFQQLRVPNADMELLSTRQSFVSPPSDGAMPFAVKQREPDPVPLLPLWNCTPSTTTSTKAPAQRRPKIFFIHIFKTAGSSFRRVFELYGEQCNVGVTLVMQCSGWEPPSSPQVSWQNHVDMDNNDMKKKKPCGLKYHQWRRPVDTAAEKQHRTLLRARQLSTSFVREHTDILAGHFSLGVAEAVSEQQPYQYIAFFRDPVEKLVSGMVYARRQRMDQETLTAEYVFNYVKQRVTEARQNNEYKESYSRYLLTYAQKQQLANATVVDRVMQVRNNLKDYGVVVGIVEKMDQSIAVLQYLMDASHEMDQLFTSMSSPKIDATTNKSDTTNNNNNEKLELNKSDLPTTVLARLLMHDKAFAPKLREYLKYDFLLYHIALSLHEQQYNAMLRSSPQRRNNSIDNKKKLGNVF